MYKLYSMQRSGNSYKVRLALALLNAPYCAVEIDILRGESRTPDFLAKNPSGQVPLLEVADGRHLAESNAILWYVAAGTPLSPEQRIERAEALQWMFFEQHALEPNIGAAYFWLALVKGGRDLQTHALEDWMERGYAALQVMENHLQTHHYFAANQLTVADIALYGYTHVAAGRGGLPREYYRRRLIINGNRQKINTFGHFAMIGQVRRRNLARDGGEIAS
jgi:glutathione S-transferase